MTMVTTRLAKERTVRGRSVHRIVLPFFPIMLTDDLRAALDVNVVLVLRSDARYLSLIRSVTQDICQDLGLTFEVTDGVKLAVGEAVANAMEHGSPNGIGDTVVVVFTKEGGDLRIEIIDEGPGIRFPVNIRRCRRRNRGFGMVLMRNLMDTVQYIDETQGTHLVMTKRLPC